MIGQAVKWIFLGKSVGVAVGILTVASLARVGSTQQPDFCAQPVGYERWNSVVGFDTGVFFDKTFSEVYANWSSQLAGPGLPADPQKDKRLIDIEVRYDATRKKPLLSGVWIENKGCDRKSSWLLGNVVEDDVPSLVEYLKLANIIVVDIERYQNGHDNGDVFAMILQENPNKFDWDLELAVVEWNISYLVSVQVGFRVLDIDYLGMTNIPGGKGQAQANILDIVKVENPVGTTFFVPWQVKRIGPDEMDALELNPFRAAVDVEDLQEKRVIALIIDKNYGYPNRLIINQSKGDVVDWQNALGHVRDLEGGNEHPFGWYTLVEDTSF